MGLMLQKVCKFAPYFVTKYILQMQIILGRDAKTGSLQAIAGNQRKLIGAQGALPETVAPQHCSLNSDDAETFVIDNLQPECHTFVDSLPMTHTSTKTSSIVELGSAVPGAGRYRLPWNEIVALWPAVVDLAPLKTIYENYDKERRRIQLEERKFNNLRGLVAVFTIGGGLIGTIIGWALPDAGDLARIIPILFMGAAVLFSLFMYRRANQLAERNAEHLRELEIQFHKDYVCSNPNCKQFFGFSYDILEQKPCCPYCKSRFKRP